MGRETLKLDNLFLFFLWLFPFSLPNFGSYILLKHNNLLEDFAAILGIT